MHPSSVFGALFLAGALPYGPALQESAVQARAITAFERALGTAIMASIDRMNAQVAGGRRPVELHWDDTEVVGFELPQSADVVFVARIPTLYSDVSPRETLPIVDYSEQIVQTIIDTLVDRSSLLMVKRDGRVAIVAWSQPQGSLKQPSLRLYVVAKNVDLDAFGRGSISRGTLVDRIVVARAPAAAGGIRF